MSKVENKSGYRFRSSFLGKQVLQVAILIECPITGHADREYRDATRVEAEEFMVNMVGEFT